MATISDEFLRAQLGRLETFLDAERKQRLHAAIDNSTGKAPIAMLLQEVDAAIERMEKGTYGLCDSCHDAIEKDRLIADPLVRYCLDHLTTEQQRALERDLELASRIQRALLPQQHLRVGDWQVYFHYEPAGPVSGDYCDLILPEGSGDLLFLVGDVSGKGVAASMLMSHLHAMFRSLASMGLPLDRLVAMANRVFCESTIAGQYATLVCGRAGKSGEVEICNAGHCPTLWARNGEVSRLDATGLPLGMFSDGQFATERIQLSPGDTLFLYTDGLSEMRDPASTEYGVTRLAELVGQQRALAPPALTAACLDHVKAFSGGTPRSDDVTVMAVQRAARAAASPA